MLLLLLLLTNKTKLFFAIAIKAFRTHTNCVPLLKDDNTVVEDNSVARLHMDPSGNGPLYTTARVQREATILSGLVSGNTSDRSVSRSNLQLMVSRVIVSIS